MKIPYHATHLNGVPTGHINTYRGHVVHKTKAGPKETLRLERPHEMRSRLYLFVRFLRMGITHHVEVDLGDRCLDITLWRPTQGHVEVTHGGLRQRLAPLDELGVRRICRKSRRVRAGLPN